jgi:hypothetical protein
MTVMHIWIFIVFNSFFQEVPYKPQTEFEIKFDMSFKQRDVFADKSTVKLDETRGEYQKRTSTDPLPFLVLHIKLTKIHPAEAKSKIVRDDGIIVYNKKIEEGQIIKLEVGFTDDIKDQIKGFKHEVQFLSTDKRIQSKILIEFDKDGNYFVNDEKRGRI